MMWVIQLSRGRFKTRVVVVRWRFSGYMQFMQTKTTESAVYLVAHPANARTKVTWVPLSACGGWTGSDRNATNSPDNGIVQTWLILNTPVSLLPIYTVSKSYVSVLYDSPFGPCVSFTQCSHTSTPPPVADPGISDGSGGRVLRVWGLVWCPSYFTIKVYALYAVKFYNNNKFQTGVGCASPGYTLEPPRKKH